MLIPAGKDTDAAGCIRCSDIKRTALERRAFDIFFECIVEPLVELLLDEQRRFVQLIPLVVHRRLVIVRQRKHRPIAPENSDESFLNFVDIRGLISRGK